MERLTAAVDRLAAETRMSGVVRVDRGNDVLLARAYGLARRGDEVPATLDTRFGIASGTKGLTALTIASLIERGQLRLTTPARSLLGGDLPLIGDGVTVEHPARAPLGHWRLPGRGCGPRDRRLRSAGVSVHELASTEDYLRVLGGHPPKALPGEVFAYNNNGYVVLALLAERATNTSFYQLVAKRVLLASARRTIVSQAVTSDVEVDALIDALATAEGRDFRSALGPCTCTPSPRCHSGGIATGLDSWHRRPTMAWRSGESEGELCPQTQTERVESDGRAMYRDTHRPPSGSISGAPWSGAPHSSCLISSAACAFSTAAVARAR
jgi:CubicO group peptidase (beta-lactamase class C family)